MEKKNTNEKSSLADSNTSSTLSTNDSNTMETNNMSNALNTFNTNVSTISNNTSNMKDVSNTKDTFNEASSSNHVTSSINFKPSSNKNDTSSYIKENSSCVTNNKENRIEKVIIHDNENKQTNSSIRNNEPIKCNGKLNNENTSFNAKTCAHYSEYKNNENEKILSCSNNHDSKHRISIDNSHYIDVKAKTQEHLSQPPILTAAEYIREKKYDIKIEEWFNDIWCCLIEDTDIIITKPILNFIFKNKTDISTSTYDIFKSYREQYKNYLNQCKIPFEILKYYTNIVEKYPVLKGDLYVANNPTKKTWIKLSFKNFKESIMLLSSSDSKETRKMLILLEQIFYDYNRYAISYHTRQIAIDFKNKLYIKEKENNELKNKICIINDIVIQKGKLYRDQIFYIATSRLYGMQNIFKVGGLDNRNLIKTRFGTYNTNDVKNDSLFYVAIYECHDYRLVEYFLSSFLANFKIPNKKELYKINFDNLNSVVRMVINQFDEYISYFNKVQPRFVDNIVFIRNLQENIEIQNKEEDIVVNNKHLKSLSS